MPAFMPCVATCRDATLSQDLPRLCWMKAHIALLNTPTRVQELGCMASGGLAPCTLLCRRGEASLLPA